MNQTNMFEENYHGILTHDGSISVAKTNIRSKILNITADTVLVKSNRKNKAYVAKIHKDMIPLMYHVKVGDKAHIKFRNGQAWIVGFTPATADKTNFKQNEEPVVTENTDWITFFDKMEMGE